MNEINSWTSDEGMTVKNREPEMITNTVLAERRKRLHEQITGLEKERSRIEQEIDSLKNKVIKLQAIIIERLEQINEKQPSKDG